MLVSEILRSCTHGRVAEAAVLSIGGDFAASVRQRADREGLSLGDFTAAQVQHFSKRAGERDWRHVTAQMRGEDLPVLSGLRSVMQRMLSDEAAL